ncbi:hypothetical protein N9L47_02230 [Rhodobacteraceae bacterium]|nr:hypothetical protein [Paracoccaceae bacterium]
MSNLNELEELEEQIRYERAQLSRTLDNLTNSLAPGQIASKLTSSVDGYGGEIGRQAMQTAQKNPAAFALVAAGLGLLFTGGGSKPSRPNRAMQANDPLKAMQGFDKRVENADAAMKAQMATATAAPKASKLREKLESGLDALPPQARHRVMKARHAAVVAQEKVEAQAAEIARKGRSFHNDQPIAVGAIALGVGALIGALLPSTRRENELLGERRDTLMASAQFALQTEMDQLKRSAQDGVESIAQGMRSQRTSNRNAIR